MVEKLSALGSYVFAGCGLWASPFHSTTNRGTPYNKFGFTELCLAFNVEVPPVFPLVIGVFGDKENWKEELGEHKRGLLKLMNAEEELQVPVILCGKKILDGKMSKTEKKLT